MVDPNSLPHQELARIVSDIQKVIQDTQKNRKSNYLDILEQSADAYDTIRDTLFNAALV